MKIEFENSIRRLSFFLPSTGHQNYLDKSLFDSENTCSNAFIVNFEGESKHFLTKRYWNDIMC